MTKKELGSRIALVAVSTALTLIVAEIFLGLIWPGAEALDLRGLTVRDEELGHRLVPNASKTIIGVLNDYETEIEINDHGFRSPDYSMEPAPGTVRIALMGDSEVFGVGVEADQMLNAGMERLLNREGGTRYEVLNFAVPGTGTTVQNMMLEKFVLDWRPDAVIFVATVSNDLSDNAKFMRRVASAKRSSDTSDQAPRRRPSIWRRATGLNLYRLFRFKVLPYLPEFLTPPAGLFGETPHSVAVWYENPDLESDFSLMTYALLRSRDACEESGAGLYLTALPPGSQFVPTLVRMKKKALGPDLLRTVEADPDRPQRMLRDFAGKSGITYVEVLEEFRKLAEEGVQLRHPNDGHLNGRGTSELARILVDAIRDEF